MPKIMFTEPSMTVQSEAPLTDINYIIARAIRDGRWPSQNPKAAAYMDCVSVGDYSASLQKVENMRSAFDSLPALVRDRFSNDPLKLLQFLAKPANKKEAQDLGLLKPDVVPEPKIGKPESKPLS